VGGWSPIVELRQYSLHPGRRDELIDLFDSTFVESQEEVGMKVIGQFRDRDEPDRFVWLRGFPDMATRAESLAAFYGGPVWRAHREAANATMIDSDDVLLLRPARTGAEFALDGERGKPHGVVEATVVQLNGAAEEAEILSLFAAEIAPRVVAAGGSILGSFVTEAAENTFPSLPVREGERVLAWFAGFAGRGSPANAHLARQHVLRLEPTSRSLLHGRSPAAAWPRPRKEST
jgi:hypothetical protein